MAFKLHGRILETFDDLGTGTVTLDGAVAGFKTFSSEYSNGDTVHYFMEPQAGGSDFEEGYGTYSAGTLARTSVIRSSNSNNVVNWAAGTKIVGVAPLGPSDLSTLDKGRVLAAMGLPLDGFLHGLTLSNNGTDATNDIDVAAGVAADSTAAVFMRLSASVTKRLDAAWAVGSGNGGLDTGSIANTTYHVWLIMRSDTGVVDVLFSTSASAPTMPANYDYKRRIGSITRVSAAIVPFTQNGDEFLRKVPINAVNTTNPGTSAVTVTLPVPTGIVVGAIVSTTVYDATPAGFTNLLVTSLAQTDTAPANTLHDAMSANAGAGAPAADGVSKEVRTNTSAQIRYRVDFSDASVIVLMTLQGWRDTRGRLA